MCCYGGKWCSRPVNLVLGILNDLHDHAGVFVNQQEIAIVTAHPMVSISGVIQVFGLPNMRTVVHCLPPKDWTEPGFMGLGMIYTAMPVTNAVPAVVAARPGIVTLADLPPITGRAAQ